MQSVEEAKHKQILIAGTVPSNSAAFIPTALNDLIGTKFKVILGFRGSPDQALAMLREEVNAIGGMSWEAIQTNHQEWLDRKDRSGCSIRRARSASKSCRTSRACSISPSTTGHATSSALLGSGPDIGRSIVAEPGIPAERAAALRKALMETMEDPEFVAEMHKRNLDIEPLSGEEVQSIVAASVATPKELVDQAKRYIGGNKPNKMMEDIR